MSQVMSQMKHLKHLKIPLQDIKNGTENFNEKNCIGRGGYGRVYKGILDKNRPVAVKKLDDKGFQGKNEFYTEVRMLSQYHHKNIVTLLGFCDEGNEMILVYEYVPNGSLDTYLNNASKLDKLQWLKRLKICVGAARALDYLHNVATEHRVIHRDIKSSNILLDENWDAKVSDFGLSRIGLSNQENTFLITNVAGTYGYCDPQYERTGILTKESDVYSFGVVLFEVLCGRLVLVARYHDERRFLQHLARRFFENGEIDKIIDHRIRGNIRPITLTKFSTIAYQCLQERREERPTMAQVVQELESALQIQLESYLSPDDAASIIRQRFRSFLVRRSQSFLALSELVFAKGKLKELKTLFYDDSYRNRIAHDAEERRSYVEKIIVLLLTVDVIEGPDVLVRATRRSILEKLEKMMDEVDPQPQGIKKKEFDMMLEWRHVLENKAAKGEGY